MSGAYTTSCRVSCVLIVPFGRLIIRSPEPTAENRCLFTAWKILKGSSLKFVKSVQYGDIWHIDPESTRVIRAAGASSAALAVRIKGSPMAHTPSSSSSTAAFAEFEVGAPIFVLPAVGFVF